MHTNALHRDACVFHSSQLSLFVPYFVAFAADDYAVTAFLIRKAEKRYAAVYRLNECLFVVQA